MIEERKSGSDVLPGKEPSPTASSQQDLTGKNSILSQLSAPQITLPKGGGALKSIDEQFSVNAANGTLAFSIPLPLSAGRNGFQPSLALSYNSGAGHSAFGLGWEIRYTSIQRRTDKQLPRYQDAEESDLFLFSGAEDLVPALKKQGDDWAPEESVAAGYRIKRYRPRVEGGHARIERITAPGQSGCYWKVTDRDNTVTFFGYSPSHRIADPADPARIFKWLPEISFDDKGNCMLFAWKAEDTAGVTPALHERNRLNGLAAFVNRYLKHVWYGNITPYLPDYTQPQNAYAPALPAAADFLFQLVLDYGEHTANAVAESQPWPARPDPCSDYRAGFEIRTYRLCRRILLFHHFTEKEYGLGNSDTRMPYLVRSLDLHYQTDNNGGQPVEVTCLSSLVQTSYVKDGNGYQSASLPPLAFDYQPLQWSREIKEISKENILHAPAGLYDDYRWIDLYGEGLSGILTEQSGAWYYKHNLGNGAFAAAQPVAPKPAFSGLSNGMLQLQDLDADGRKQLVVHAPGVKGYFELTGEKDWKPFREFEQMPQVDMADPNLKMLDLDGDGRPELLIAEEQVFTWYPSLGVKGYDTPELSPKPFDDEQGPAVVFADGTQSIFLADMSGDGLTDIVRVRNGEICYWPNLGYGRFGAKVNMSNAPVFDSADRFNPALLQLADVSGTGASDILYLGNNLFKAWINLGGNAWSQPAEIDPFPYTGRPCRLSVIDLLGAGTSCIVWSSPLPEHAASPMRYIDLMGGEKPYLLRGYRNNLGKETAIHYRSAAYYYLQDKAAGTPWITRLPFPVHCVSKVVIQDRITRTVLANEYSYHHGYYDHEEREFRGFGRVDQRDTEQFEHWIRNEASNIVEAALHQPPVLTRTWYHTGLFLDRQRVLSAFAQEYWQDAAAPLLPDAQLPAGLSAAEQREALRACKGMVLRQEVFALDGTAKEKIPYHTAMHNCQIRQLQPRGQARYAVFTSHESEAVTCHYERAPQDARVQHVLNTVTDELGNVLESATVTYGRSIRPQGTPDELWNRQHKMHITYTKQSFTNDIITAAAYRLRKQAETAMYELTGIQPAGKHFLLPEIKQAFDDAAPLAFEQTPGAAPQKRLLKRSRILYAKNDLSGPLPAGTLASLAIPYQGYQLALTGGLVQQRYNTPLQHVDEALLLAAKLVQSNTLKAAGLFPAADADGEWWSPSGIAVYSANAAQRFYLPEKYIDALGNPTTVQYYGNYCLLVSSITDALGSITAVTQFDFRTLQPQTLKDANDNISAVRFNILGLVAGTAVQGKGAEADSFMGFQAELAPAALNAFFADPAANGASLLQQATSRFVYDINRYMDSGGTQPVAIAAIVREIHHRECAERNITPPLQYSFEYSGGMGQVVMKKAPATPGDAWKLNAAGEKELVPNADPRWIGTGRTVLNNKGKPVKQYEPYFAVTHAYEQAKELVEIGFSPVVYYDPAGRAIKTQMPDGTFSLVAFDAWQQQEHDVNDTVKDSSWYAQRINGGLGAFQQAAAQQAAVHHQTPVTSYLDSLGRACYKVQHNKFTDGNGQPQEAFYHTMLDLDVEGNTLKVTDARGNAVMLNAYNMLGRKIYQQSMDAGRRWMLANVAGKELYSWNDRQHRLHLEYDALQRPVRQWLLEDVTQPAPEKLLRLTVYGEGQANDKQHNLRGKAYRNYDQSGLLHHTAYDFKGKTLNTQQTLTKTYKLLTDWNVPDPATLLETAALSQSFAYDALGRPVKVTLPDGSVLTPAYNKSGLLDKLEGLLSRSNATHVFVKQVAYNAKGQRERIVYGNNTATRYDYDALTYRLIRMLTTRNAGADILQDLHYTYDPIGNITALQDDAQQTHFFNNAAVTPHSRYVYDAVYRLIKAEGREHAGQQSPADQFDNKRRQLVLKADMSAMQRYVQRYEYDDAGNMLRMVHHAGNGALQLRWTNEFAYQASNNRLNTSSIGGTDTTYQFDVHGNMLQLQSGSFGMDWNYADQLQSVDLGGGGKAWYVYNAEGQRVRKVIEQNGLIKERIYAGSYELYREKQVTTVTLERETLHIMDDRRRIALVESRTFGSDAGLKDLIRYQYANHLETAALELDGEASPEIISYEEYYPFGSTAFQAGRNLTETAKRYRYTGKERDAESGLYYHGARYYAPWLARWTAADPAGLVDGENLYRYCRNNPVMLHDPKGTDPTDNAQGPARVSLLHPDFDLRHVSGSLQFRNLLQPNRSVSGSFGIGGAFRTGYLLNVPSLDLNTSGSFSGAALANVNTVEGMARVRGTGMLTLGTVGEGLWGAFYATGSLSIPVPSEVQLGNLPGTLAGGLGSASGSVHFLGTASAGSLTLGTATGDLQLYAGGLTLNADIASLGNLARFRLNANAQLLPGGDANFSGALHGNILGPFAQLNVDVRGQLRSGTASLTAHGNLNLLGGYLGSARVNATGTVSAQGYNFSGTAEGWLFPLTQFRGGFSASSQSGLSAYAHVWGLSYMPGMEVKDPSPIPPVMRSSLGLPADIEHPSGPMLGYSFFRYNHGALDNFSVGVVPNFSDLTKSSLGITGTYHFNWF